MFLIKSITHAWQGIISVAREERNFRYELAMAGIVVVGMFAFDLTSIERAVLWLAIAAVLVLEMLNSLVERIIDILKPRIHHYVQEIKDITAGAVLVAAAGAAIVGLLIFWPHFGTLIGK